MDFKKTDLQSGEELTIPRKLFETAEIGEKNVIKVIYIDETPRGMRIRFFFNPPSGSDEVVCYDRFIDWASIYCGSLVIRRKDGTKVYAEPVLLQNIF